MDYFSDIPCGETLPLNNVHAVSVSFPRLSDVIGYEENDPRIMEKIKSGYPRFITHPFIVKIQQHFHKKFEINSKYKVLLISSKRAAHRLFAFIGKHYNVITDRGITGVCLPKNSKELENARLFLQHTGYIPSSRLTEQYLLETGLLSNRFKEDLYSEEEPQKCIQETLASAYNIKNREHVKLGLCGMNAIFTAFKSLEKIHNPERNIFVLFGWLYLDTMEILKKFSPQYIFLESITSIPELQEILGKKGKQIATIFTEVTTNPLIQTPDLPAIHNLAKQYDIPVVVDATFGTPINVEVLPYSDIIIESLTKFASGNADLLMGALIVNDKSHWSSEIMKYVPEFLEIPFKGDLRRLALVINRYEARMKKINENTLTLIEYFKKHKRVKEIYWPYQELTRDNYMALQRHPNAVGGVFSIIFDQPLARIYDRIRLPKGPSLGTEFTLLMPYVYLAHYDLISTTEGKKYLKSVGIDPDLLRISVGIEDSERIINAFEKALV